MAPDRMSCLYNSACFARPFRVGSSTRGDRGWGAKRESVTVLSWGSVVHRISCGTLVVSVWSNNPWFGSCGWGAWLRCRSRWSQSLQIGVWEGRVLCFFACYKSPCFRVEKRPVVNCFVTFGTHFNCLGKIVFHGERFLFMWGMTDCLLVVSSLINKSKAKQVSACKLLIPKIGVSNSLIYKHLSSSIFCNLLLSTVKRSILV